MGTMMKCGHAANATTKVDGESVPACLICGPDKPGWNEPDDAPPSLDGRKARCHCGATQPSDPNRLAFFEYRGPGSHDATKSCHCGYFESAHPVSVCDEFAPRGPSEFDRFYCGCNGWD